MVGDNTKVDRRPLLPLRHEQGDFFVCDIFDAAPKGDMASMAHPIFTLSTKPDTKARRYESPDGKSFVEIKPNMVGLATVHDRDVLIYCISQVMAALNLGKPVHKVLRFKAYDLLVATNRSTDGRGYEQLRAALDRLQGTRIETNIITNGIEQVDMFGLLDRVRIVRETRDGRMLDLEITLSDWVFNALAGEEVLTLNRQYFQLRKPLERRLYELVRKQCGTQPEWKCGLAKLQARTGSTSSEKEFKRLVKAICKADEEHGHMPDYEFRLVGDVLIVNPKPQFLESHAPKPNQDPVTGGYIMPLSPDTLQRARELAPTWDINVLVGEWRTYSARQKEPPKSPDAAFLGFCKNWFKKRGRNGW
jgi:hypothetical protein